jgi:aryl-alcohol dehydrogenase-like predicted oxidoreductase
MLASIDASLAACAPTTSTCCRSTASTRHALEETLDALDDVVRAGKARYVGFCNLPAWLAMKALALSKTPAATRFVSAQMYYSIAGRDIEREIVPLARIRAWASCRGAPRRRPALSGKFDLEGEARGPLARAAATSTSPRRQAPRRLRA